jgi:hypothetical protein
MGAECDADHYLVVVEVRERLAVNKQAAQKFDVERFHLRKLSLLLRQGKCLRLRFETGLQL